MSKTSFVREIDCSLDEAVVKITEALMAEGYGILTRIDFHTKIKEKLNKEIPPTVILGACKPSLAFELFNMNSDVTSVMPCNVVIRDLGEKRVSVEIAKPTALLHILDDRNLMVLAKDADMQLKRALYAI